MFMSGIFVLFFAASFLCQVTSAFSLRTASDNQPFFVCGADGNYPITPGVCQASYVNCIDGTAYLLTCPGTSVYDPVANKCTSLANSSCGTTVVPSSTASTTVSPTTVTDSTTSTTVIDSTSSSTEIITSTTPVTDSSTSSSTEIITSTTPVTDSSTSSSTEMSTSTLSTTTTVETSTSMSTSTSTQVVTESTSSSTMGSTTTSLPGSCPSDSVCKTPDGFLAIPCTCGSDYYVCVSCSPYVQTCPNGTIFDPNTLLCTTSNQVSCATCSSSNGRFPLGPCCNEYKMCIGGAVYSQKCPGTSVFDGASSSCVATCPKSLLFPFILENDLWETEE